MNSPTQNEMPLSILICDDEKIVLDGVTSELEKINPKPFIHTAESLNEEESMIKETSYDIIIQDVKMWREKGKALSNTGGLKLLNQMTDEGEINGRYTYSLFMSNHADYLDFVRESALGVSRDRIIKKPLNGDYKEIRERIITYCQKDKDFKQRAYFRAKFKDEMDLCEDLLPKESFIAFSQLHLELTEDRFDATKKTNYALGLRDLFNQFIDKLERMSISKNENEDNWNYFSRVFGNREIASHLSGIKNIINGLTHSNDRKEIKEKKYASAWSLDAFQGYLAGLRLFVRLTNAKIHENVSN